MRRIVRRIHEARVMNCAVLTRSPMDFAKLRTQNRRMPSDQDRQEGGDLTPLGELLETAREGLGLSKRHAAERAGISEVRWRQVVTRPPHGQQAPRPRRNNLIRMAQSVGVDPDEALTVAGFALLPKVPANTGPGDGWVRLDEIQDIVTSEAHALITTIQDDESLSMEQRVVLVKTVIELQTRLRRALRTGENPGRRFTSTA
jgi:transcriptional regulator with XRE-family HTH domain